MTTDDRMTWGLIGEVLDVLERHGYHRYDNRHTAQAVGAILDLAYVYDGTRDVSYGTDLTPEPPGPADQDAVIVSAGEVKTLLAALDDATEYKRDRAETCADCADQSCGTCQWRLQAARDYSQMAAQMLQAAEASAAAQPGPGHPGAARSQLQAAADREAGQ
jgi:hypothetical protein